MRSSCEKGNTWRNTLFGESRNKTNQRYKLLPSMCDQKKEKRKKQKQKTNKHRQREILLFRFFGLNTSVTCKVDITGEHQGSK